MCELLGISVRPAATLGLYLSAFRPRAESNPSGWGMAWYDADGAATVVKEPIRADQSRRAAALAADPPSSTTFVVHVRAATVGRIAPENTHPFHAVVHGRDWVFAHNGTIRGHEELPVGDRQPQGDTDSEVGFHHVVHRVDALGPNPPQARVDEAVMDGARELSRRGKANFLLTDGTTLYASYDGWKTLHFLTRRAADLGMLRGSDEDYDLELTVEDSADERAVIVASVPLTTEPWTRLDPGEILVCRGGLAERHSTALT